MRSSQTLLFPVLSSTLIRRQGKSSNQELEYHNKRHQNCQKVALIFEPLGGGEMFNVAMLYVSMR